ncbi:cathelicidin-related peptide Oh-Cath-like [Pelobates cultripes]|uniref:Cathelicidin-related peptide Oh-Cath-like n=1 Tax=Pelobates cultripes TaxID=61616 RepID=A0AAD1RUG3_PELCU|nr:cathelicidin-related peptide Oh-Cath-like [Pelobates cultripes]
MSLPTGSAIHSTTILQTLRAAVDYVVFVDGVICVFRERSDKDLTFQQLTFIIKETQCKKSEENINKPCAFKEDGVVKQCAASIFPGDGERKILVTCNTLYQNSKKKREVRRVPCRCVCCIRDRNNICRRNAGCLNPMGIREI